MDNRSRLALLSVVLLATALLADCAKPEGKSAAAAQATPQPTFATPEEAVSALVAAGEKQDPEGLQDLLGPGTAELVSSGDSVADRTAREAFLSRYSAYHELVAGGPNDLVLLVGEDRWPLPIPLVGKSGRWYWDGAAGTREVLMRRIGANELRTIDVMQGFVAAERDYAASGHDDTPAGAYAVRLRSNAGKHDGLYWEAISNEPQSPAGPLLAAAGAEGYAVNSGGTKPYHGYMFRLLTSQGPEANGGARDYLVNGKLVGGFAALAYPNAYGVSGVMTFMVNEDGVVWQRDLGADTAAAAAAITQFNPDNSWTPIPPEG
jgi:hypothetical protein